MDLGDITRKFINDLQDQLMHFYPEACQHEIEHMFQHVVECAIGASLVCQAAEDNKDINKLLDEFIVMFKEDVIENYKMMTDAAMFPSNISYLHS